MPCFLVAGPPKPATSGPLGSGWPTMPLVLLGLTEPYLWAWRSLWTLVRPKDGHALPHRDLSPSIGSRLKS